MAMKELEMTGIIGTVSRWWDRSHERYTAITVFF